jgi:hypothetical protein
MRFSRRRFMGTVVGTAAGVLAVGFDPPARSWVTASRASATQLRRLPELDGTLLLDDASRELLPWISAEWTAACRWPC